MYMNKIKYVIFIFIFSFIFIILAFKKDVWSHQSVDPQAAALWCVSCVLIGSLLAFPYSLRILLWALITTARWMRQKRSHRLSPELICGPLRLRQLRDRSWKLEVGAGWCWAGRGCFLSCHVLPVIAWPCLYE